MTEFIYTYSLNLQRKIKENKNSETADEKMSKVIEENKQEITILEIYMYR